MIVSIYIQGNKVDLFDDEDITVNSSVAMISDITKNSTDYTKSFTVPASESNNKLFKHYYDASIDNSFDARIKVDGEIRLDGLPFRIGKFRLSKVSLKKGAPSSYSINFWGNLLSLKDKVGKDYLKDLDLEAYDHAHSNINVLNGLTSYSLGGGNLIYSLMVKKQYYYSTDPSDTTTTDTLTNIGYGDGSGVNGIDFNDVRPALRIIKIIEAIETKYPTIKFSRDFFGRDEFTKIFTWLNPSKDLPIGGDSQQVDFDSGDTNYVNLTTDIGTFPVSNTSASNDNYSWVIDLLVYPEAAFGSTPYTIKVIVDGEVYSETEHVGDDLARIGLSTSNAPSSNHEFLVTWEVSTTQPFEYTTILQQRHVKSGTLLNTYYTNSSVKVIDSNFIVERNIPKVKIIDFLKGLFNMFKLVVIPQDDGTIYVNTLKSYYADGKLIDITPYVDNESYDVDRGVILNEINFLFQEPKTILNQKFEENTNIAYGDSEVILKDDDGEVLDGTKLEFTLPFETVLFERLRESDNSYTNIQYGAIIDEELKPVNPKMVLFYNIPQKLYGDQVSYITAAGVKTLINTQLNTPHHSISTLNPNFSLLFNSEFSTWDGARLNNTLYKNYYEDYILSIFNPKKRTFKYKAVFPLNTLMSIELNDVLQIGNQLCRIDSFKTNITKGTATLNLINSFEEVVGNFTVNPTDEDLTFSAQSFSSNVTNSADLVITPRDVGDGLGWLTVTRDGSNVFYDVTENTGVKDRFAQVDLSSKAAGGKTITVYIQQKFE
tara:strand:- start:2735 stop:5044 length:2310 start_codon:yes stop_codon:yes gene_type:complete